MYMETAKEVQTHIVSRLLAKIPADASHIDSNDTFLDAPYFVRFYANFEKLHITFTDAKGNWYHKAEFSGGNQEHILNYVETVLATRDADNPHYKFSA